MNGPLAPRRDVSLVDTTLAVGQHVLWGRGIDDDDALAVLSELNRGRFDRIEVPSPARRVSRRPDIDVANLTTWDRRATAACPQTPLRWVGPLDLPLVDGRRSVGLGRLLLRRAAEAGLREVRLGDASNDIERARALEGQATEAGVGWVAEVAFTTSPRHDDEVFVSHAEQLAELGPTRLCLTDPSGLLTPEHVGQLMPRLTHATPGIAWEFLGHCNNWLGPLNALAAAELGATVHTAIRPLASAESVPPLDVLADNLQARDRGVRSRAPELERASALLAFLARRGGLPVPSPREYSHARRGHHLSEPHLDRLRKQLAAVGASGSFTSALAEVEAVRADLGHPVVTAELGDVIVDQSVRNVVADTRYDELVAGFAGMLRACPDDAPVVARGLEERLADGELAEGPTLDVSLAELRDRYPALEDAALIEHAVTGDALTAAERERRLRDPVPSSSPVVRLVRALATRGAPGSISIERPGFALRMQKGLRGQADARTRVRPHTTVHGQSKQGQGAIAWS